MASWPAENESSSHMSPGDISSGLDDQFHQSQTDSSIVFLNALTERNFQRVRFFLRDIVPTSSAKGIFELLSALSLYTNCKDEDKQIGILRWAVETIYTKDLQSDLVYEIKRNELDEQSGRQLIVTLYQQLLIKLDCKLGDEDLQNMKFLVVDIVPQGVLEKVATSLELFEVLENRGNLSRDDLSLLKWLLENSPRKDLLPLIQNYSTCLSVTKVPRAYGLRRLPPDFVKRQGDVEEIKKLLKSRESAVGVVDSGKKRPAPRDRSLDRDVIGIRGMGGIGKTVLTQAVCWQIKEQRQVIWLTIGQTPDLLSLLNTLASVITDQRTSFSDQAMAQNFISEVTVDKDCLLVLDDVWDVNHAAAFDVMNGTCQLLVTTRNADVIRGLRSSQIHKLGSLGKKQSRELLMKSARQQLSDLSQQVRMLVEELLEECGGLPLALALVGSSLVDADPQNPVDWQDRRDGLKEADLEFIKSCFPADSYPYENLLAAIEISFNVLLPEMKERFLNFAIFPEDIEIPAYVLEMVWGISGRKTRECLSFLEQRSLLQSGTMAHCYVVHDILLDYVRGRLGRDKKDPLALQQAHSNFLDQYRGKCQNSKWSSGPKGDVYFYHHLAFHLTEAGRAEELENVLLSYDWLNVKLEETEMSSLLGDFRFLCEKSLGKEEVKLLRSSLMLSSNIVSSSKDQLGGQLLGRLKAYTSNSRIVEILQQVTRTKINSQCIIPLRWCLTPPGGPLMRIIDGRSRTILSIVVTPDVKRIITGGADASVRVWDYETGKELHKMLGHTKMAYSIALSLNADILVSGSFDNTIKVWDMDTLTEVVTLSGHKDWVSGVLITPDSKKVVSSSYDATIKIWDLDHCTLEHTLEGHEGHVRGIAVTPDGRRLLSASQDKTVKVWNLGTLTLEDTLQGHSDTVYCVFTSPDCRYVVSGSDDTMVKVWDIERATEIRSLIGHVTAVYAVAMTPDGNTIVSAGGDATVKMWSFESGDELASLQGHSESIRAVIVSPDGKAVISGSQDRTYKLWNIDAAQHNDTAAMMLGHKKTVQTIAISDDGKVCVTGSCDCLVKVWDCENFKEVKSFSGHTDEVLVVTLNTKHRVFASGGCDRIIKLWDLDLLKERCSLEGHACPVQVLSFSSVDADRLLISGARDNCVIVWEWRQGSCLLKLDTPIYDILYVTLVRESVVACNRKHSFWQSRDISEVLAARETRAVSLPKTQLNSSDQEISPVVEEDSNVTDDLKSALASTNSSEVGGECESRTTDIVKTKYPSDSSGSIDSAVVTGPDSRSFPALMIRGGTRLLTGSGTSKLLLRCQDIQTGMEFALSIEVKDKSLATSIDCSADGNEIIIGTDHGQVIRYDMDASKVLHEYNPCDEVSCPEITTLTLTSSNEFFLVGFASGHVVLYSMQGTEDKPRVQRCGCRVNHSCAVLESCIAFCDSGGSLHLLCAVTNTRISVKAHEKSANALAYNKATDCLISGSDDMLIKGWKVSSIEGELSCDEAYRIDTSSVCGSVKALAFSPDGSSIFSGSTDDTVSQWSPLHSHDSHVRQFSARHFGVNYIYAGSETLTASLDDGITIAWDIETGEVRNTIQGWGRYQVVTVLPQGDQILSTGYHHTLKRWSVNHEHPSEVLCTYQHFNEITTVCVVPSGSHVITGSRDKILRLWVLESGECVSEFHFEHMPEAVTCNAKGRVCVGLRNGEICFLEVCL